MTKKIHQLNEEGGDFIGGLVILENEQWRFFEGKVRYSAGAAEDAFGESPNFVFINYNYPPADLEKGWKNLEEYF